jgi:alanine or glycine:cation symporter, AGCS family
MGRRTTALLSAAALASCLLTAHPAVANATAEDTTASALESFDETFASYVVAPFARVIFFDLVFWDDPDTGVDLPFILAWLFGGALFFTFRFRFVNVRAFKRGVAIVMGRVPEPGAEGEVSHFQALASALSATVGLGNIAGVAVAVQQGGPGAVFWMVVAGFLGMSAKFAECTLAVAYREKDAHGRILGGPMRYLEVGLREIGFSRLGRPLALAFAVLCIGGSLGGGNMFQANQSYAQAAHVLPALQTPFGKIAFGVVLSVLVGLVIVGGMKRIGRVAGVIVPFMCLTYVLGALFILITHASVVPGAFKLILDGALTPEAGYGGALGVALIGIQRAAFSNEAGIGSAAIAHSAATTREPIREGLVALLEPFIDTILICTMTGLVVVVTGAYLGESESGVTLTSSAFGTVISWFPTVLGVVVLLFAYSTMLSWSYYGERCFTFLFGDGFAPHVYRSAFLLFIIVGAVLPLETVIGFSDLMMFSMAIPNMIGAVLLSPKLAGMLRDYLARPAS